MAENPTNIKDKNERRDVRRNTSNQIVSYTLPTNSVEQYGLVKLPAIKEELNRAQFERQINTNVTEFQFNIPDTNLQLISLNDVFFPVLGESPVLDESPVLGESVVLDESPVLAESVVLDESPVLAESVVSVTPPTDESPVLAESVFTVFDESPVLAESVVLAESPVLAESVFTVFDEQERG